MLKVLFNGNDVSEFLENFLVDEYELILLATGELAIGYYKPINCVYVELKTANSNDCKLSLSYNKSGVFSAIPSVKDDTRGFKRSGFIKWSRNLEGEVKSTVGGTEMYWYKLKLDTDSTTLNFKGINLVFSNDNDLVEEYPSITEMLPENATSFISFHVAARKDILSYFRTQGKLINTGSKKKDIDAFDLLNIEEVRDASKFLTLAKIFYWISDAVDDKWYQKAKDFEKEYEARINVAYLSLDSNDDGKEDKSEVAAVQFIRIERQ